LEEDAMDQEFQRSQENIYQSIADYLGLSLAEVEEASPDYEEELSSEDMHVGWIVNFPDDTPEATKGKLGGRLSHNLPIDAFGMDDEDEPDFDDEPPLLDGPPVPPDQAKKLNKDDSKEL